MKSHKTCVGMFIHKLHKRRQEPTTAPDGQIRSLDNSFEHSFGPRGLEFERSNLQKFKCSDFTQGVGMLKFRVDRRLNRFELLCPSSKLFLKI